MTARTVNLLLICHANVCRSRMAESVFRHLLAQEAHAAVHSAGLEALSGVPPHPLARKVLAARGYPAPAEAQAMRLAAPMLDWADLVLSMESAQRREIVRRHPAVAAKVWTLGHWLGCEVDDPVGCDEARFDAILRLIERSAQSWLPALTR